jgi:hypothetical protein
MKYILILTALLTSGAFASEFDDMKELADMGITAAHYNLGVMYSLSLEGNSVETFASCGISV